MNCDCKTRIERLLKEQALQEVEGSTEASAELEGYGLRFSGGGEAFLRGFMPYKVYASYEKKGQVKEKKVKGNMIFSFCPFCGEPVETDAPRAAPDEQLRKNAERYEWLRSQHWSDGQLAVVANAKANVRLGANCPSHELLDAAIDAAMREAS